MAATEISNDWRIQKVSPVLLKDEKNKEDYIPKVVSIGPFHHGKTELKLVEDFKPIAVELFISGGQENQDFYYNKVLEMIGEIRNCYEQQAFSVYSDDAVLARMMLYDACFVIHLMEAFTLEPESMTHQLPGPILLQKIQSMHKHLGMLTMAIVLRDVYLLENQIPLGVVKLLINLRYEAGEYKKLLDRHMSLRIFGEYRQTRISPQENRPEPLHLLEAFHRLVASDVSNAWICFKCSWLNCCKCRSRCCFRAEEEICAAPATDASTTAGASPATGAGSVVAVAEATGSGTAVGASPPTGAGTTADAAETTGASTTAGAAPATGTGTVAAAVEATGSSTAAGASPPTGAGTTAGAVEATGAGTAAGAAPATGAGTTAGAAPATGADTVVGAAPPTGAGTTVDAAPETGAGVARATGSSTMAGAAPPTGAGMTADDAPATLAGTVAAAAPPTGAGTTASAASETGAGAARATGSSTMAGAAPPTGAGMMADAAPATLAGTVAAAAPPTGAGTTADVAPPTGAPLGTVAGSSTYCMCSRNCMSRWYCCFGVKKETGVDLEIGTTGGNRGRGQPSCLSKFLACMHSKKDDAKGDLKKYVHSFSAVTDLKAKGIYFKPSSTHSLKDAKFKSMFFYAILELPAWGVSIYTKVFFSNMIAYELSPNSPCKGEVTSYINFMKSLIESPEDVKELREKKILYNTLGSDKEVLKVYKSINTYGANNPLIFHEVKERIQAHYNSKMKTWIAELIHTHFRTPWNLTAFLAATTLLALASAQLYYSVHRKSK